jgi:hypothetical protein
MLRGKNVLREALRDLTYPPILQYPIIITSKTQENQIYHKKKGGYRYLSLASQVLFFYHMEISLRFLLFK